MNRRAVEGYWWTPSDPDNRVFGRLTFSVSQSAKLRIFGSFPGFRSYVGPGFGAPSARSVVLGESLSGEEFTLLDAVEGGKVTHSGNTNVVTIFYSSLVLRHRHVSSWNDFTIQTLSIELLDLDLCLGESRRARSGRRSRALAITLAGFSVRLYDSAITQHSWRSTTKSYRALATITSPKSVHFDEFFNGPVKTIRMICDFSSASRVPLTHMSALETSDRMRLPHEIVFSRSRLPRNRRRRSDHHSLFTFRELGQRRFQRFANRWHAARKTLAPSLEVFSSLANRSQLDAELRFLTLVNVLESFHRLTRRQRRSARTSKAVARLIAGAPAFLRDRVRGVLGQLGSPSLEMRLGELFKDLPAAFLNPFGPHDGFYRPLGPGPDFLREVVNTRNYLTHLAPTRRDKALKGFALFHACLRLEWMFRYRLLQHLGFSRIEANGAVPGRIGRT